MYLSKMCTCMSLLSDPISQTNPFNLHSLNVTQRLFLFLLISQFYCTHSLCTFLHLHSSHSDDHKIYKPIYVTIFGLERNRVSSVGVFENALFISSVGCFELINKQLRVPNLKLHVQVLRLSKWTVEASNQLKDPIGGEEQLDGVFHTFEAKD